MTTLLTAPMPLTFWGLLSTRLQAEVRAHQIRTMATTVPLVVTVETAKDDENRLAAAKRQMQAALERLDGLSLLALTLRTQLEACQYQIGATALQGRIEFIADMHAFYEGFVQDRPSRTVADQAVSQLRTSYASASKPMGGEWAAMERSRLLAQSVQVPVLSAEDAVEFEASAHHLRSDLDALKASLGSLQATTRLSLVISPELVPILSELGIGIQAPAVEDAQLALAVAPAEQPAPPADAEQAG